MNIIRFLNWLGWCIELKIEGLIYKNHPNIPTFADVFEQDSQPTFMFIVHEPTEEEEKEQEEEEKSQGKDIDETKDQVKCTDEMVKRIEGQINQTKDQVNQTKDQVKCMDEKVNRIEG